MVTLPLFNRASFRFRLRAVICWISNWLPRWLIKTPERREHERISIRIIVLLMKNWKDLYVIHRPLISWSNPKIALSNISKTVQSNIIKAFTDLNLRIWNCSTKVLRQSANISDRYRHLKFMAIFGYEWPIDMNLKIHSFTTKIGTLKGQIKSAFWKKCL